MNLIKFLALLLAVVHCSTTIAAQSLKCANEQLEYATDKRDEFCVFRAVVVKKGAPEPVFENSASTKVAFLDSNFTRLPDQFFQAFPQLEWLVVINSGLEVLTIKNRMRVVHATGNQIKSLQVEGSAGAKLTTLSLRDNPFTDVNSIAKRLLGLEVLDLSGTEVAEDETIKLAVFAPLVNLTELYLARLEAAYLENDEEMELPSLKVLDVSGNFFTPSNFKLRVFRTLPNMEELFLRDASMTDLSVTDIRRDMPAVKRIHLGGNDFNCKLLVALLAHLKERDIEAPGQSSSCPQGYDNVEGLCCKSHGNVYPPRPPTGPTASPPKEGLDTTTVTPIATKPPTGSSTPIDTTKTQVKEKEKGSSKHYLIYGGITVVLLIGLSVIGFFVHRRNAAKRRLPIPSSDNQMQDL